MRARPRRFRPTFARAFKPSSMPTPPCRGRRASDARLLCRQNTASTEDLGPAPARYTDHGRDNEQHNREKEEDLGDLDGGAGDTAVAHKSCDQGNDQERNNPNVHGQDLLSPILDAAGAPAVCSAAQEPILSVNEGSGLGNTENCRELREQNPLLDLEMAPRRSCRISL